MESAAFTTEIPTAVYWLYDAAGVLLYIGASQNPERRWRAHALVRPWWPEVADKRVEWHTNRDSALIAEREAIRAEMPVWNVVHKPTTSPELVFQAEEEIATWAERRRELDEARDELVREAFAAGISKYRIYELTGIARTTIDKIIEKGSQ